MLYFSVQDTMSFCADLELSERILSLQEPLVDLAVRVCPGEFMCSVHHSLYNGKFATVRKGKRNVTVHDVSFFVLTCYLYVLLLSTPVFLNVTHNVILRIRH